MPAPARQQALTALLPVLPGREGALEALLRDRADAVRERLARAPNLHFARFLLLPPVESPAGAEPRLLVVATTFDGALEAHLDELWAAAGAELGPIVSHCAGFRAPGGRAELGRLIRAGLRPAAALFTAEVGLSVARVREDARLRLELRRWLDAAGKELRTLGPQELGLRVQAALAAGAAAKNERSGEHQTLRLASGDWLELGAVWLRSLVLDLRDALHSLWHDAGATAGASVPLRPAIERCFSHVASVKPGRARRAALRFVLRLLARLAGAATGSGQLSGACSLHGARWVLLDDGRLLFLADFDGGPDSTLGAFVDRAATALGMIWSHTLGFPATLGWRLGGARDGARFRRFAQAGYVEAVLSYSAYPELGCAELRENAEVRALLGEPLDEGAVRRLLGHVRD